jgi:hypothetical protein
MRLRVYLPGVIVSLLLLPSLVFSAYASTIYAASNNSGGVAGFIRGGLGVKARIDNYQLAWGNRDIVWYLSIEGDFVLFGSCSGTVPAMGKGFAHSSIFPPAMGFGAVTVTLNIYGHDGVLLETHQRSGFMIGPFVILL